MPGTTAIRIGIALLGAIGFALSYDALQQMAVAIHIRSLLTYAFPLVIDGFIAIGVGALIILRTAPLRARLYVWALVGAATATSIWANALHAVRLNQQARHDRLHLDDVTVGALSAIAPLALAGAVHLYLVVRRRPTPHAPGAAQQRHNSPVRQLHQPPGRARPAHTEGEPSPPEHEPDHGAAHVARASGRHVADHDTDVPQTGSQVPQPPEKPSGPAGRKRGATVDQLLAIGRTAPRGRGGRVSRRNVEQAVRAKGYSAGKDRLNDVTRILQAEADAAARQQQTDLDREPVDAL
ncbi:hypothetical protein CRI70_17035 [Streptomyces sp. Ru87]|nr:hypothetical protein CRI70_17035 [Streptomyces sp. Ru87]